MNELIDIKEIRDLFATLKQEIINEFVSIYYLNHDSYNSSNTYPILYCSSEWTNGNIPVLRINSSEEFCTKWNKYKKMKVFL